MSAVNLFLVKKAKGFEQIMSGVRAGAELSKDYCTLIICAALIAAVGLGKFHYNVYSVIILNIKNNYSYLCAYTCWFLKLTHC